MGVCQSDLDASATGGENEFDADMNQRRCTVDKKTDQVVQYEDGFNDKPETDFFEFEEVAEGEEFMAVKPWIGAVVEPDNHPEVNKEAPDVTYAIEHVYGYRC